jgi:murein L,D-transpeptidase YafK
MIKAIVLFILIVTAAVAVLLFLNHRITESPPSRPAEQGGETVAGRPGSLSGLRGTADLVFIEKKARRLTLFRGGKPLKSYRVALGFEPVGKKTTEGDGKTPEGRYVIDRRKPNSRFYRALHISYPNAEDKRRAAARGVSPGGDIMIHGLMKGMGWLGKTHLLRDWTLGCIALTNEEIDEIWRMAPDGTTVEIVP